MNRTDDLSSIRPSLIHVACAYVGLRTPGSAAVVPYNVVVAAPRGTELDVIEI
jgi:hypothetical protein